MKTRYDSVTVAIWMTFLWLGVTLVCVGCQEKESPRERAIKDLQRLEQQQQELRQKQAIGSDY